MRRAFGLLTLTSRFVLVSVLFSLPLAAQRRSAPSPSPFPDSDLEIGSVRGRSSNIMGVVSDAQSHIRLNGVRVDLEGGGGGILATAFTSDNGNFQFNNVRGGSYELIFEQNGYQDDHERLDIEGPLVSMTVQLKRVNSDASLEKGTSVSVRELSIPQKAREAMAKGTVLLYQKSDYAGSIKEFERAIHSYPDYYEAYAQLGMAHIKLNQNDQAEQALRKSVDVSHEQYSDGYALLAALYTSEKRFSDAEPPARKAVGIDAKSWHAQSELAQVLLGLGRPEEAEEPAKAAVEIQPDNPSLRLLLADVHVRTKNETALLEDLNAYLKIAPNGPYADKARQERDKVQQHLQNSQASPAPPSSPNANP
jgi:cytochrome c-type biogenesis protein CcmH/NrfG